MNAKWESKESKVQPRGTVSAFVQTKREDGEAAAVAVGFQRKPSISITSPASYRNTGSTSHRFFTTETMPSPCLEDSRRVPVRSCLACGVKRNAPPLAWEDAVPCTALQWGGVAPLNHAGEPRSAPKFSSVVTPSGNSKCSSELGNPPGGV